jgi:hypothetical protein
LDGDGLAVGHWFPDEEICRARKHTGGLKWVENQKKIAKKSKRVDLYFNRTMLDRDIIVRAGIEGLDPDSQTPEKDLDRWLEAHPERTPEQLERAKQRALLQFEKSALSRGVS